MLLISTEFMGLLEIKQLNNRATVLSLVISLFNVNNNSSIKSLLSHNHSPSSSSKLVKLTYLGVWLQTVLYRPYLNQAMYQLNNNLELSLLHSFHSNKHKNNK